MFFCSIIYVIFLPDVTLIISPRYGIHLGGQSVIVQGPCFEPSSRLKCIFGTTEVTGVYVNNSKALCISPMLRRAGRVEFTIIVDGATYSGATFTACKYCS